jgi:hypothetical protein
VGLVEGIPVQFVEGEAESFFDSKGIKFLGESRSRRISFVGLEGDAVCKIAYQEEKRSCLCKMQSISIPLCRPKMVSLTVYDKQTLERKRVVLNIEELAKRFLLSKKIIHRQISIGNFQNWFEQVFKRTNLRDLTWFHQQKNLVNGNDFLRVMKFRSNSSSRVHLICIGEESQNGEVKRNAFDVNLRRLVQVEIIESCDEPKVVTSCFNKALCCLKKYDNYHHRVTDKGFNLLPYLGEPLRNNLSSLSLVDKRNITRRVVATITKSHEEGFLHGNLSVDNIYYDENVKYLSLGSSEKKINKEMIFLKITNLRCRSRFFRMLDSYSFNLSKYEREEISKILNSKSFIRTEKTEKIWRILQAKEIYHLGKVLFKLLCEADSQEEQDVVTWKNLSEHLFIKGDSLDMYIVMRLINKGFGFTQVNALVGMLRGDYHLRPDIEQVSEAFDRGSISFVVRRGREDKDEGLEFWQKIANYLRGYKEDISTYYYGWIGRRTEEEELSNWTVLEKHLPLYLCREFPPCSKR